MDGGIVDRQRSVVPKVYAIQTFNVYAAVLDDDVAHVTYARRRCNGKAPLVDALYVKCAAIQTRMAGKTAAAVCVDGVVARKLESDVAGFIIKTYTVCVTVYSCVLEVNFQARVATGVLVYEAQAYGARYALTGDGVAVERRHLYTGNFQLVVIAYRHFRLRRVAAEQLAGGVGDGIEVGEYVFLATGFQGTMVGQLQVGLTSGHGVEGVVASGVDGQSTGIDRHLALVDQIARTIKFQLAISAENDITVGTHRDTLRVDGVLTNQIDAEGQTARRHVGTDANALSVDGGIGECKSLLACIVIDTAVDA